MVALTPISSNIKTGPIPVSTSSKVTCPDACPLKNNGCYASFGPLNIHWDHVTNGTRGLSFDSFCESVSKLPRNQLWRHNQAGDLEGKGNRIDVAKLKQLVEANRGRRGFAYTHKPLTPTNAKAIRYANDNGFTINLSANNLKHADELKATGAGPVVVILPANGPKTTFTPAGHKVVTCPATYSDTNCANCGLCQKQRSVIVGFPAHGNAKRKVSEMAS